MPRPCHACGMTIEFITGPNGKAIPAQKIKTIYRRRDPETGDSRLDRLEKVEPSDLFSSESSFYVSHFETCPNAGEFSRKTG